jgi:hypothetical protein
MATSNQILKMRRVDWQTGGLSPNLNRKLRVELGPLQLHIILDNHLSSPTNTDFVKIFLKSTIFLEVKDRFSVARIFVDSVSVTL